MREIKCVKDSWKSIEKKNPNWWINPTFYVFIIYFFIAVQIYFLLSLLNREDVTLFCEDKAIVYDFWDP